MVEPVLFIPPFLFSEGEEGDQHLLLVLAISVPVLVVLVIVLILVLLYRQVLNLDAIILFALILPVLIPFYPQ